MELRFRDGLALGGLFWAGVVFGAWTGLPATMLRHLLALVMGPLLALLAFGVLNSGRSVNANSLRRKG